VGNKIAKIPNEFSDSSDDLFSQNAGPTMDAYIYEPVGKTQIRLVTVTQNQQGRLEAAMQHVELNEEDPVKFTAVSYTWGDPNSRVQLPCGENFLSITTSLYEALGEIINFSPHGALWIDQICINQEDNLEKADQVRKMDVIYDSMIFSPWICDKPC
jgi:hypothetical protein